MQKELSCGFSVTVIILNILHILTHSKMGEDKKDPNKTKQIRELISIVFNRAVITQRPGTCMFYRKS